MPRINIEEMLVKARGPQVIEGKAEQVSSVPVKSDPKPEEYEIPAGPLRQLDHTKLNSNSQVLEQLNALLPLNKYGLPDYIYRADMIDHAMMLSAMQELKEDPRKEVATKVQSMLQSALVYLDFSEGFPKFEEEPLWKRLPYEPELAFQAFMAYIQLEGVRDLNDLVGYKPADLMIWYHTYLWAHRVKAYDMYLIVHHQRLKLRRALGMEDNHYQVAGEMIQTVLGKIRQGGDDFWAQLKPLQAATILDRMVKVQRMSVGLSAQGGSSVDQMPLIPTVQSMMEQVSEATESKDAEVKTVSDEIMESPEALEHAQDLLLTMQGAKNG